MIQKIMNTTKNFFSFTSETGNKYDGHIFRTNKHFRGTNDYVTEEIYEVLRVYAVGNSRKNELYLARHLDFFITRLTDTVSSTL